MATQAIDFGDDFEDEDKEMGWLVVPSTGQRERLKDGKVPKDGIVSCSML
jgi:hypothetical protein